MMTSTRTLFVLGGLGLALFGCGDDGGATDGGGILFDRYVPDGGGEETWSTVSVSSTGNDGLHLQMRVDSADTLHLGWLEEESERTGDDCTVEGATGGAQPATRNLWALRYATVRGTTVSVEDVSDISFAEPPPGLDLGLDGTTPVIASVGGDSSAYFCRSSDLALYRRGGAASWTETVAVQSGDEVSVGHPSSDFGDVVGYWAGMAIDDGNVAVAYQDVHLGGIQSEDVVKSDLELAIGSGASFAHRAIMPTIGAGIYNRAAFDSEGRLVVMYVNPQRDQTGFDRQGLWVARSDDDGATWEHVLLVNGPMSNAPSMHISGTTIRVVYYDSGLRQPALLTLSDPTDGFAPISNTLEPTDDDRSALSAAAMVWGDPVLIGDPRYEEGRHPSIDVSSSGIIGVTYIRCGATSASACDSNAGVVFAYLDPSVSSSFEQEVVVEGSDRCGLYPNLAFDSVGDAHVSYQCIADGAADVFVAHRAAF